MRFMKTLVIGIALAAAPGLHAQVNPATAKAAAQAVKSADKPAAQAPAKPAASAASTAQNKPAPTTKPATPASKPGPAATETKKTPAPAAKPAGKAAAKPAAKKSAPRAKPAASANSAPAAEREPKVAKRDPFDPLVGHEQVGSGKNGIALPAGKAGLQVSSLRLDGIVRAPNGMIAVVSNPQSRTYFLREGDQLYDGRVEKIAMDGVSFHEIGKDAFGKPVEHQVNKRIYASAGEQQ